MEDDPLGDFDFESIIGKPSFKPPVAKPQNNNNLSKTITPAKPTPANKQDSYNPVFNQTLPNPSKRGALVEDLFGTKTDDAPLKRSGSIDDMPDFKLNDKYLNMSSQSNKADEDIGFGGGYQPSALSGRNNTGMKRNVSFTDDLFGVGATENIVNSLTRPKTSSAVGNNKQVCN